MSAQATGPGPAPDLPERTAPPGEDDPRRRGLPRLELRGLRRIGLAALGPAPRGRLPDALEHVAKVHRAHHPDADLAPLTRAWALAESSHRGQTRKSGEPYITHPLAVTLILAELGAETTTLTASLLHDTVEDTDVTLDQVGEQFGEEVRFLVDGVTKLEKVDYGAAAEPETFRKMLVATGNDVRVMSIKLADRLHNMRTLGVMRPEKQARIAKVTRDVLIPLAERLGVQALKSELEDLVFAILHPQEYTAARALLDRLADRPDPLAAIAARVRTVLDEAGIAAQVLVRPRHLVSVHRIRLARSRLTAADLGRLLVLVAEDADCYAVLGELHTCFPPVVSAFKDFIAAPKFNLYQSLHTAITGAGGEVAETLIRTHRMHRVAEAGVIALGNPYAPTEGPGAGERRLRDERADPTRPGWLSRLLEWQSATPDPDTFWSSLRDDLAEDHEITVYGEDDAGPVGLPAGATCVDAAYARYGPEGRRCVGARVNGRLTALATTLHDGDSLHLLMTSDPAAGPAPDWLRHSRTPAARLAIGRWLATHAPADRPAAEPPREDRPRPSRVRDGRAAPTRARGAVPHAAEASSTPQPPPPSDPGTAPDATEHGPVAVADGSGAAVRLAGCCTPVPPDALTGFAVRGGMVAAHRVRCPVVARMTAGGRVPVGVRWSADDSDGGGQDCRVTLLAEAFTRPRLMADLTEAIAAQGVAVVAAVVEPPHEQRVHHRYTLRLPDAAALPRLMRAMRRVAGVYDVWRVGRDRSPAAVSL